ncbi:indole-3-glycerol-phosphate synthase [[Eubacterium] cellulosolvens]
MSDFLDAIVEDVKNTIDSGYYEVEKIVHDKLSLKESIINCRKNSIISEIKLASPSKRIVENDIDILDLATLIERGGALGLSIITEPKKFRGSLPNFIKIRKNFSKPLLMKDFIISKIQIDAANKIGADAILLIQTLFDRGYCDSNLYSMIKHAHEQNLEVLLETHTEEEFLKAIKSDSELIGINNRDLKTLNVDIQTTKRILSKHNHSNRIIVSESGIESLNHIHFLRDAGCHAFLIGTSIMLAKNIEAKVRELVEG